MIISASRRTDIPALYAEWFVNRLKFGYCDVQNPFYPGQVSRVSLETQDVDCIVFWTRYADPLLPLLKDIDNAGHHYCFLYTLLDYPDTVDRYSPSFDKRLKAFLCTAAAAPGRIVWRYDPIYPCAELDVEFHKDRFTRIATLLAGKVDRVIISFVDLYKKTANQLIGTGDTGMMPYVGDELNRFVSDLAPAIAGKAREYGMTIQSCAEAAELRPYGIEEGACIDGRWLSRVFGIDISQVKDTGQRKLCKCAKSRDIGAYDTCLFGCVYCYAVRSRAEALKNRHRHDPSASSLLPATGST